MSCRVHDVGAGTTLLEFALDIVRDRTGKPSLLDELYDTAFSDSAAHQGQDIGLGNRLPRAGGTAVNARATKREYNVGAGTTFLEFALDVVGDYIGEPSLLDELYHTAFWNPAAD
jgi:hypothetical protein